MSHQQIKAIETEYKGYRFRSRLEARWAVFFDTAGINWEYEPEGFEFNGKRYLPDFYLPDFDYFFEVKGTVFFDEDLIEEFAEAINKTVLVAIGSHSEPGKCEYPDFITGIKVFALKEPDVCWDIDNMFLRCDRCGRISIMNCAYASVKNCCNEKGRLMPLDDALKAVRSARFEHGERPC